MRRILVKNARRKQSRKRVTTTAYGYWAYARAWLHLANLPNRPDGPRDSIVTRK
jgi:hypothetical protein